MDKENKKMAVFAGCTYAGTEAQLHGPINDVTWMRDVLINRFGFDPSNIEFMTDAPDSPVMPTGANIKAALNRMFQSAEAGDILFFHFSGHGTQIPKADGVRKDEAIVPCDFNLVLDDDFRDLVNSLPRGASFTFLSDSCHSGGLIDKEKEQIGPHTTPATIDNNTDEVQHNLASKSSSFKPKHLPHDVLVQLLEAVSNREASQVGPDLDAHYGQEASSKFRQMSRGERERYERLPPDMGILLSGCQPDEISMDVPEEVVGVAFGALSNAVQLVLGEHEGPISNRELAALVRKRLEKQGFPQHPCLYCSDENAAATFLGQTA